MCLQHLLHWRWHHVKVKTLRHFLAFSDIIQCHWGKYWLNFYLKPATRNTRCVSRLAMTLVALSNTEITNLSFYIFTENSVLHQALHWPSNQYLIWNARHQVLSTVTCWLQLPQEQFGKWQHFHFSWTVKNVTILSNFRSHAAQPRW